MFYGAGVCVVFVVDDPMYSINTFSLPNSDIILFISVIALGACCLSFIGIVISRSSVPSSYVLVNIILSAVPKIGSSYVNWIPNSCNRGMVFNAKAVFSAS
jgi:hypothetical protein